MKPVVEELEHRQVSGYMILVDAVETVQHGISQRTIFPFHRVGVFPLGIHEFLAVVHDSPFDLSHKLFTLV